jgi:hypothetical protein
MDRPGTNGRDFVIKGGVTLCSPEESVTTLVPKEYLRSLSILVDPSQLKKAWE